MIAGPVLSPCSFHSSWSCAALRQGHPASRDQLTDQEQCEAAKRITTRGKILSIDGPKTKRQKRSGFQGRQSGPPQYALQRYTVGKGGREQAVISVLMRLTSTRLLQFSQALGPML